MVDEITDQTKSTSATTDQQVIGWKNLCTPLVNLAQNARPEHSATTIYAVSSQYTKLQRTIPSILNLITFFLFSDFESNKGVRTNVITVPSNDVKETKPNSEEPPQPIQQLLLDFLTPPKKEAENVFNNQAFKLEPKITLNRIFHETKEIQPNENRFSLLEGKFQERQKMKNRKNSSS